MSQKKHDTKQPETGLRGRIISAIESIEETVEALEAAGNEASAAKYRAQCIGLSIALGIIERWAHERGVDVT